MLRLARPTLRAAPHARAGPGGPKRSHRGAYGTDQEPFQGREKATAAALLSPRAAMRKRNSETDCYSDSEIGAGEIGVGVAKWSESGSELNFSACDRSVCKLGANAGTRPAFKIQCLSMESRKDRLPKGRSYPLKPSVLEAAIANARLSLPVRLTRWNSLSGGFSATFYPEDSWSDGNSFWVRCDAVPSERAAEIRAIIEAEAIPAFIRWAKEIEGLDARSPRRHKAQHFDFPFPQHAAEGKGRKQRG